MYKTDPSFSIRRNSTEKMVSKVDCVGIYNGESFPCSIESTITGYGDSEGVPQFDINSMILGIPELNCKAVTNNTTVEELFVYGGDLEDIGSRPITYVDRETGMKSNYLLDGVPTNSEFNFVQGQTKSPSELVYTTPEQAGILSVITQLTAPEHPLSNYRFVFRSGSNLEYDIERHIVGLSLSRMQGCVNEGVTEGLNYILVRGDVTERPEANWMQRRTIFVASDLANLVFEKESIRMSYNDGGLPMGGKHGLHQTHRTGKDIDINANGMGYDCNTTNSNANQYINDAFKLLYGEESVVAGTTTHFPNIDCYKDGIMHIDALPGF